MRKYALPFVALSLFVGASAHAEFRFGALAGGNYTTFMSSTDVSASNVPGSGNTFTGTLGPSGLFGYQFGGLLRYEKDKWGIETNLLYTHRTAKWHGSMTDGTDTVRSAYEFTFKQIQVPIMGSYKYNLNEKLDFRFNLGLYGSYGLGKIKVDRRFSTTAGSVVTDSANYSWSEAGMKKFNFGWIVGGGTDFKLEGGSLLGAELRALGNFNDMSDTLSPGFTSTSNNRVALLSLDLLVSYVF